MTAGIEAPAKEATTLLNTKDSEELELSVMGYATLTFSMVVYLPVIWAQTSLLHTFTASSMPNFNCRGGCL